MSNEEELNEAEFSAGGFVSHNIIKNLAIYIIIAACFILVIIIMLLLTFVPKFRNKIKTKL